jgi:uncharacterized membrane protein YbhN (UPF0104 family)
MRASRGEQRKRPRLAAAARVAIIAAIIAGSGAALYAERATIATGLGPFRHASGAWAAAGFGAEAASMASFALLQRQMLRAVGTRLTVGTLLGIAYTSNAISVAVPVVGSTMAFAYNERQFLARGADLTRVSLALIIAGVISTVAFALVAGAGAVASGNPAAAVAGLLGSAGLAVVAGCIVVVLHSPRTRRSLQRPRPGCSG